MDSLLALNIERLWGTVCREGKSWLDKNKSLSMREAWEVCSNGLWMLHLLRAEMGDDKPAIALRYLPDVLMERQFGKTKKTLKETMIEIMGAEYVETTLSGTGCFVNPIDRHGLDKAWAFDLLDLWWKIAGRTPSYDQLYELVDQYIEFTITFQFEDTKETIKWLADWIRKAYKACPLWMSDLVFYVIYSVDVEKGVSLTDYRPPYHKYWMITESNDKSSEYGYLDDDEKGSWSHGKHRKYVAEELPLWMFEEWATNARLRFEDVQTMGSLTMMGWLPAFSMHAPIDDGSIRDAYVTPMLKVIDGEQLMRDYPVEDAPQQPEWTDEMWERVKSWLEEKF